ncbi:hypothetical protein [Mesorhizobium argentiipisi]|uniref:HEAT repeat domain-containing protein n=1 Tax=Mesorhizobium argentiipisi TaxID=3015175 RepID=A0ABU8KPN6_9HYPH
MRSDDRIEEAIAGGKRNAEVMELVGNWCAHARAKRMGGVGMIEQMTGLPISHFSMECDHAPGGGIAAWDFGESALDFYDRNCTSCTKRKPVGLPNLSKLVTERAQARKIAAGREQVELERLARELEERAQARQLLRKQVDAVNQSLIDDLDTFDRKHEDVDRKRLSEAAKLAPERIDRKLLDLLFNQSGATTSLALVALEVASHVVPNERRTVLLAQRLFSSGADGRTAANVLIANLETMNDGDLVDLVPAAAELACPDRERFGGAKPHSSPKLFLAMWKANPEAVHAGIGRLLDRKTVPSSQLAGRAMGLIIEYDSGAAKTFVREAASRYVRAHQLLPDLDRYENLGDLAGAIDLILTLEPEALDAVLQDLAIGANVEAQRNIASIYAEAWRDRLRGKKDKPHPEPRLRLGLDRLIWLPAKMFDSDVLRTVSGAFRNPPNEVEALLEQHTDKLIGAALLLDETVADKKRSQSDATPLSQQIEWQNLSSAAYEVIEQFLKAAAKVSKTEDAKAKYIAAIQAIPEERAMLRGVATKSAMKMAESVEGLKAVLPTLYSGLVGASVLGRAHAAMALADIPSRGKQNLPALVYEAFCVLLLDQFVAVHKSAVRTLSRISLPEDLKTRAALALFHLVSAYSGAEKDDRFLLECVDRLARLADHLPDPDKLREFLCLATLKSDPVFVRSEVRALRFSLGKSENFPLIVAHVLPQHTGSLNGHDLEADLIQTMTPAAILKHKDRLAEVANEIAERSMWLSTMITDSLYRAGAREEAAALLDSMATAFGTSVKDKQRALFVGFPLLAYKMEAALAAGNDAAWATLAGEWDAQVTAQRALLEDKRARDSRSRFSFPH